MLFCQELQLTCAFLSYWKNNLTKLISIANHEPQITIKIHCFGEQEVAF